ncbi:MAG: hypothetical protein GF334_06775 [Candidatus Altiarchaeales archaeon]|nr:hypothetical protein [Candidatus Altiarchaeales archaeon]
MTQVRFVLARLLIVLARLLKVFLVGFFVLLGTSLTLAGFGLIPEWNGLFGDLFLHDLWVKPWSIVAAMVWFGIAVLFFNEEESQREKKPILDEYSQRRSDRLFRRASELMEEERTEEALEVLQAAVEGLASELSKKKV